MRARGTLKGGTISLSLRPLRSRCTPSQSHSSPAPANSARPRPDAAPSPGTSATVGVGLRDVSRLVSYYTGSTYEQYYPPSSPAHFQQIGRQQTSRRWCRRCLLRLSGEGRKVPQRSAAVPQKICCGSCTSKPSRLLVLPGDEGEVWLLGVLSRVHPIRSHICDHR